MPSSLYWEALLKNSCDTVELKFLPDWVRNSGFRPERNLNLKCFTEYRYKNNWNKNLAVSFIVWLQYPRPTLLAQGRIPTWRGAGKIELGLSAAVFDGLRQETKVFFHQTLHTNSLVASSIYWPFYGDLEDVAHLNKTEFRQKFRPHWSFLKLPERYTMNIIELGPSKTVENPTQWPAELKIIWIAQPRISKCCNLRKSTSC